MKELSDWVGRNQQSQDVITNSGVRRYCATLGLDANVFEAKKIAPYGYNWCLCLPDEPMSSLGVDGHPEKGGFLPPVELPRRMWASSKLEFFAKLPIGATITKNSTIASVNQKTGKTGALVFVEVEHETQFDGETAIKESQTIVYREASSSATALPSSNSDKPSGWQVVEECLPTSRMLFRYSALTFNSHRIHYDLPYTQDQEMYPDLVVHGPLMASLLLQLATQNRELKKFSFRAQSAAFCNQVLYLVANFNEQTQEGELQAIGADGRPCLAAQAFF